MTVSEGYRNKSFTCIVKM